MRDDNRDTANHVAGSADAQVNGAVPCSETVASGVFRRIEPPAVFRSIAGCHAVSLIPNETAEAGRDATTIERSGAELPAELSRAVESRRRSFLAGRHCAARALAEAGHPWPIPALAIGARGAPVFPDGFIGSITHSARLAAAVALRASTVRAVGIDCELLMDVSVADEVVGRVLPEAASLGIRRGEIASLRWPDFVTAVFSAKESLYKCLSPVCGVFFDFDAMRLDAIDSATMQFTLLHSLGTAFAAGERFTAVFSVDTEHAFTAVTLAAGAQQQVRA